MLDVLKIDPAPGTFPRLTQGLALSLAALFGAWAGALDLRSDDAQACILVVLGGTFLIATLFPRDAWGASLLVAGCVPFAHVYALVMSMDLPAGASLTGTILAFIPSFIGAAAGVLVRRVIGCFV
jgi:hypothetical protein